MKSRYVKNADFKGSGEMRNIRKNSINKHQQLSSKIISGTNLIIVFINLFSILFYGFRLENLIVILISAVLFTSSERIYRKLFFSC